MTERLTYTKRRDFKVCHRYFYWRHQERLDLRVQKPGRRRGSAFGTAIFACRAAVESQPDVVFADVVSTSVEDSYDELYNHVQSQDEWQALEIEVAKVKVMAAKYVDTYGIDHRRELLFDLPLVNPNTGRPMRAFRLAGKIDGLLFYQEPKSVDLIEDKFVQQITPIVIQRLPLDEQITEYVDALASYGWPITRVRYRHTRFPSINPEKAKTFKTKPDKLAEPIPEFQARLEQDVEERPEFYLDEQQLMIDPQLIEQHRMERWATAQDIMAKRRAGAKLGLGVWDKSTSRCLEFGGCAYLALCEGRPDAGDLYVRLPDNPELKEEQHATDRDE